MKKTRISIGTFEWKSGSINSNIIRLAREAGYEYRYDHYFNLQIGYDPIWYNAEHAHINGDTYEAFFTA